MSLVINISCTGSDETKRVVLNDGETLKIGRTNHEATLVVDPRLSRKHFMIRFIDGLIEITHLSHTNPTLVAAQGSSDFQKVKGERSESGGCRIMAGSHRFILTVSQPDSVDPMGFSDDLSAHETPDGSHAHFWSDVDSEPSHPVLEGEGAGRTDSAESRPRSRPPAETVPIARENLAEEKTPHQHVTQPNVFFDDDEPFEEDVEPPAKPPEKKPKTKKPFFPIGDDFFDD